MNVDQVFATCKVPYKMVYEPERHSKPNGIKKFMIKLFEKNIVVSENPYPKNSRTAPPLIITNITEVISDKN